MFRPRVIRAIQHYFDSKGLVEVETPGFSIQFLVVGTAARPSSRIITPWIWISI